MQRHKILFSTLVLASFLGASGAQANVSTKNGNFFIGYSDLSYAGGLEPKIERVYNSKSIHNGIFGYGWGSDYEVYLTVSADCSVVMHENGGGAQNRFTAPNINPVEVDKAVEKVLEAKRKSGASLSGSLADNEKKRLRNDARYRNDEWERLFRKGLVTACKIPDNTVLKSNKYSYQLVRKDKAGYVRQFDNGQVQTFNETGRLVRMADRNGNFLTLAYDKAGHISVLQDNFNRRLKFTVNNAGKVEKVLADNGKTATFKYSGDDLIASKDSEGNTYEYKYSQNGRHNLVEIKYSDKTTMQIGYHDLNQCENVKWIKDRDTTLTQYAYTGECAGGLEHTTSIVTKGPDGKEVSKSAYGYYEKVKLDGERYTYKLTSDLDGDRTETIYNECCGLPLEIVRNGEKTAFEYDTKGHVTKKTTPSLVTELSYDAKTNKVAKVVKYPKDDKSKVTWAQYQYDDKGNLVFAKNSENRGVKIVYDHHGRIKALVDQSKRRLEFTYNEANRPVEIKDPAVGTIQVQYSNSGDIKKVQSSGGRKIALQVTSAFQNLLEIIRPAEVKLSF
jgi:YD repeat-containing protein